MINNIEKILPLLEFNSEDDFYHLQIIKRKKENEELGYNSIIVKTYYIKSIEHLKKIEIEYQLLCHLHNARACINLNRRSFRKIAFHALRKISEQICNESYHNIKDAYNSCCGSYSSEKNKKWIIDID